MSTSNKYLHLLLGVAFVISGITAIIILTQFSRPELIGILENCANENGFNVMPSDSLALAEVIRHKIWNFHIISGIILFFTFIVFRIRVKKTIEEGTRQLKYYVCGFALTLTILLFTGLIYIQPYIDFLMNYKELSVKIHYYIAYLIGALVLFHVIDRVVSTKREEK